MNFEATFPVRYWINLGRRADRRGEVEWMFERAGVRAERFPAVDARFVGRMALERGKRAAEAEGVREVGGRGFAAVETGGRILGQGVGTQVLPVGEVCAGADGTSALLEAVRGYESAGRYALALTQRLAIRRAWLQGAEAVLIFEDDVVLHPNFLALVEALELPDDWGLFYFGCAHDLEPEPAAPGIVRLTHAADTHAFAVRAPYYRRVIEALDAHGKPRPAHPLASDRFLAALQGEIASYACFPNLAWQAEEKSDLTGAKYTWYGPGGTQKRHVEMMNRVFTRMFGNGGSSPEPAPAKLGLLFLTRGDVNHPDLWREFVAEAPERVRVFSHPKVPDFLAGGFLEGTGIAELHETSWGSISLVRATLALLRAALEDETLTHFVLLSESCVPVRPLPAMLTHLDRNPKPRFSWTPADKASSLQKSRAAALPQVPDACWRFQSQWWLLDRIAAEWVARADYTEIFAGMAVPDEAYFATVLCLLGYPLEDRVVKKAVTWTHWEKDAGRPTEFRVLEGLRLEELLESDAWFARKFPPGADIGRLGLHRSSGRCLPEDTAAAESTVAPIA